MPVASTLRNPSKAVVTTSATTPATISGDARSAPCANTNVRAARVATDVRPSETPSRAWSSGENTGSFRDKASSKTPSRMKSGAVSSRNPDAGSRIVSSNVAVARPNAAVTNHLEFSPPEKETRPPTAAHVSPVAASIGASEFVGGVAGGSAPRRTANDGLACPSLLPPGVCSAVQLATSSASCTTVLMALATEKNDRTPRIATFDH
mmetsp:Transcript_9318/g.32703  ORF Transcript_9318/g.32703 Transcript_9318/m.32703 type:complete len:207 (+) Transcript_9318:584-1204(+)